MDEEYLALYVGLGSLTVLASGCVGATYLRNPELMKYPASIVFELSVFEIIMAYHGIIYALGTETVVEKLGMTAVAKTYLGWERFEKFMCNSNQFIVTVSTLAVITSNIGISLDLILTLWKPFSSGRKRKLLYNILQVITILYFSVYLVCFRKEFFSCIDPDEYFLEISDTGSVLILLVIYLVVSLVSCNFALWRLYKGLPIEKTIAKKYVIRHVLYVFTFAVLWVWPGLVSFMKIVRKKEMSEGIKFLAVICVAGSGLVLGAFRASDPAIWYKLKKCTLFKASGNQGGDVWKKPLSVLVNEGLSAEVAHWIYPSIYKVYGFYDHSLKFRRRRTHRVKKTVKYHDSLGLGDQLPDLLITDYGFEHFKSILDTSEITLRTLMESFDPLYNIYEGLDSSKGKSGSFFAITYNKRFIVKTISAKEKKSLLKMLSEYAKHLADFPKSTLTRIFGLFTLKAPASASIHFIIMDNLLSNVTPHDIFDLKGSRKGRSKFKLNTVSDGPMKDLDFYDRRDRFHFDPEMVDIICVQLKKDVELLRRFGLIDYSLFLCRSSYEGYIDRYSVKSRDDQYVYTIAVIDFLIRYDYFKFIEEKFSSVSASVKKPKAYARRFMIFISSVVFQSKRFYSPFSSILTA